MRILVVEDDLPVLILSARASADERIAGLNSGADDYMGKPFLLAEVSARIRALRRRGKPRDTRFSRTIRIVR